MTCLSEFCKKCEVKLKEGHQCKQEDLDSVDLVNNMKKCPGCKLPVFKNQGCDSITCSNCNTRFLYSTGKEGGHGSSNTKIKVNKQEKNKLSYMFKDDLACMENLIILEHLEPKSKSKDIILTPLRQYIQTGKRMPSASKVADCFDLYMRLKYKGRDYQTYMVAIENALRAGEDTEEKIREAMEKFYPDKRKGKGKGKIKTI